MYRGFLLLPNNSTRDAAQNNEVSYFGLHVTKLVHCTYCSPYMAHIYMKVIVFLKPFVAQPLHKSTTRQHYSTEQYNGATKVIFS